MIFFLFLSRFRTLFYLTNSTRFMLKFMESKMRKFSVTETEISRKLRSKWRKRDFYRRWLHTIRSKIWAREGILIRGQNFSPRFNFHSTFFSKGKKKKKRKERNRKEVTLMPNHSTLARDRFARRISAALFSNSINYSVGQREGRVGGGDRGNRRERRVESVINIYELHLINTANCVSTLLKPERRINTARGNV